MNKKIILIAGTPAEHSIENVYNDGKRDFAARTYNYAIALLKANRNIAGDNDYKVEIADYPVDRRTEILEPSFVDSLLSKSPSAIGFSVYCWNQHIFLNTARYIKKIDKEVKIIAGGPSVTFNPEEILRKNKSIDLIVTGDGEETFSELLRNDFKCLSNIRGIAYRKQDRIFVNKPAEPTDINKILSPYLADGFRPDSDTIMIEPSRGCIYRCKFCSWSKGRRINQKRRQILSDELQWAYKNGYRNINFSDTSVNMTNEQLQVIVDSLKSSKVYDKLSLSVFMKYDKLDTKQLKMIDRLRFDEIIIGLESVNEMVLRECGKPPFDRMRFEGIVERLGRMGNKITISIITGLPKDSYNGIKNTVGYLEKLIDKFPDYINFVCSFWLAILPGTRFERERIRHRFSYLKKGTPYLTSSRYMNRKELMKVAEYVVEKTKTNNKIFCEEYYIEALENGL